MFEYTIKANLIDYNLLEYMKYSLSQNINCIVALSKTKQESILSVASNNKKELINALIKEITKYIAFKFKESFFYNNLKLTQLNLEYKKALIKALVLFDIESDERFIKKNIILTKTIDINSLFYFKLNLLKLNWQEMVNVANNNACAFFSNENFLELIKFLIESMPKKEKQVNVIFNNNKFEITNSNNKILKNQFENEKNIELALVSNLIYIAPEKINLYCINNLSNSTFKILYHIFNKNINLLV